MIKRKYAELGAFPLAAPEGSNIDAEQAARAVEAVFANEIAHINDGLRAKRDVLVCCPKALCKTLFRALRRAEWKLVRPSDRSQGPIVPALVHDLGDKLANAVGSDDVVVIMHLDLLTSTVADQPRSEAADVVYLLSEYSSVTKLAFYDPAFQLPKIVEERFPERVSVQTFDREDMWKLLTAEEARKFCSDETTFSVATQLQLYQYLSGTNVGEIRRIMRELPPLAANPSDPKPAFDYLRGYTASRPLLDEPRIAGYEKLRHHLRTHVITPLRRRYEASSQLELRRYEAMIPRGLLLYGPPGVGKTEWVKFLANGLEATLFLVHGPELKVKWVGDTESAIRRLFASARQAAPSLVAIDEAEALFPARVSGMATHDASMVGQLLTEMQGLRSGEAVIIVATTNYPDRIDEAFRRPGRFQLIEVPYPERIDREAILTFYSDHFQIGLRSESIAKLVDWTEPAPDSRQDRQVIEFSGDHLRAIVVRLMSQLLLEEQDVNADEVLRLAFESVLRHGSEEPPTPAFTGAGRFS